MKKDFAQRLLKKEEEIQKLKSEIIDLNYKIRRKEIDFLDIKRTLQAAKETEDRLKKCQEELSQEQDLSQNQRKQIESMLKENDALKSELKSGKVESFRTLESQITKNFKNVNEEIKNLKNKIDTKIEKHIVQKPSLGKAQDQSTSEEKIKSLTKINSNLTSFIVILQSRLGKVFFQQILFFLQRKVFLAEKYKQ